MQTLYNWKRKYGDMDVNEARKLRSLEGENARLKRIVADFTMQNDILKEVNSKSGKREGKETNSQSLHGAR